MASLAGAGWVSRGHNVLITGATGCGKTFVACDLANAALRQGHTALYVRTPRLTEELARGKADGRYVRQLTRPPKNAAWHRPTACCSKYLLVSCLYAP